MIIIFSLGRSWTSGIRKMFWSTPPVLRLCSIRKPLPHIQPENIIASSIFLSIAPRRRRKKRRFWLRPEGASISHCWGRVFVFACDEGRILGRSNLPPSARCVCERIQLKGVDLRHWRRSRSHSRPFNSFAHKKSARCCCGRQKNGIGKCNRNTQVEMNVWINQTAGRRQTPNRTHGVGACAAQNFYARSLMTEP